MTKMMSKVPVERAKLLPKGWQPLEGLRRDIDRLFEGFDVGGGPMFDIEPFWKAASEWPRVPPVDVVEKADTYEISAELPGLDAKDIEIKQSDGMLTIKGEKKHEAEEKAEGYYLSERSYGSFERSFQVPETVNADKIEATFTKGVLTLVLPKKPEAQRHEKKISVKAA